MPEIKWYAKQKHSLLGYLISFYKNSMIMKWVWLRDTFKGCLAIFRTQSSGTHLEMIGQLYMRAYTCFDRRGTNLGVYPGKLEKSER